MPVLSEGRRRFFILIHAAGLFALVGSHMFILDNPVLQTRITTFCLAFMSLAMVIESVQGSWVKYAQISIRREEKPVTFWLFVGFFVLTFLAASFSFFESMIPA